MSTTATAVPALAGFAARYVAGELREEIEAWPSTQGAGVVVRLTERDEERRVDALTILTARDAARLMGWLNSWFAGLPLAERAELADGLPVEHVPNGNLLLRQRAAAANMRDFPSLSFSPVDVSVADLPLAAE